MIMRFFGALLAVICYDVLLIYLPTVGYPAIGAALANIVVLLTVDLV